MSSEQTIVQYTGNAREPEPVALAHATQLGIKRVLDEDGVVNGDLPDPLLPRELMREMYESMVLLRAIDEQGWKLQRSGRIAFWIPLKGQEACQVAPTLAMDSRDWIFRAHREIAPWFMRGASLELLFAQFFGAETEPQRGRRLPCLIGNRSINLVSSTTQVGTFIAHAAGAGWAAKLLKSPIAILGFFGDGATSRGEFHSAMNFAGIHRPRVVFICVNNSWAVTTPLSCQTAMPDIAAKGNAYGVRNLRVDGNDPLAMFSVTKQARDLLPEIGASLIEAVTYRLGFHTSSDNPDLYRQQAECSAWEQWDPLRRTRAYLARKAWWTEQDETELQARCTRDIRNAVARAEQRAIPGPESQFDDVFSRSTWMLEEQRARLLEDLAAAGST